MAALGHIQIGFDQIGVCSIKFVFYLFWVVFGQIVSFVGSAESRFCSPKVEPSSAGFGRVSAELDQM